MKTFLAENAKKLHAKNAKFIFLTSSLLLFTSFLFADETKIRLLENLLTKKKEDTAQVNLLNSISREYRNIGEYKKAMEYAEQGNKFAQQINYQIGLAAIALNKAGIYYFQSDFENARQQYNKALKIREALNDKQGIAQCYLGTGNVYIAQGNYPQALNYYFKALKISEELGDNYTVARNLFSIGNIYIYQNSYEEALQYYFQAKKIYEEINQQQGILDCLVNIGSIYNKDNKLDSAAQYYSEALPIAEELDNKNAIGTILGNMGVIFQYQNNLEKALEYLRKALKIQEELGDKNNIANVLGSIGNIYKAKGDYNKAIAHYQQCLTIAQEIGTLENVKDAYKNFSSVYAAMGNYKNAYQYHQLFSQIKDSIFSEESSKQITEMQTKYDTEKKEQQIKLLNKDKEIQSKDLERQKTIRNAVAGGLILVLLFSFVLINRFILIRKQKTIIETEREKSEKLLLNILPKEIAEELKRLTPSPSPKERGAVPSPSGRAGVGLISKRYEQVTVMFTDFKGFTTIAEKMSAEELVSELDFIFKKFDEIISKYPIEKIKTIGDAYMCAGGLPVANTTNPVDVVMAALEIQEFMCLTPNPSPKERGELPPLRGGQGWGLRIGIHTGSVIAGVVGDKKFAYDIWGDTVNTASRMESSGEVGKVNISGETYKMLVGTRHAVSLLFTFRGKIPAKNKGEIEMYFVEKV